MSLQWPTRFKERGPFRALLICMYEFAGRKLAGLMGGPLRKLLELLQEAIALVDSCCKPGEFF